MENGNGSESQEANGERRGRPLLELRLKDHIEVNGTRTRKLTTAEADWKWSENPFVLEVFVWKDRAAGTCDYYSIPMTSVVCIKGPNARISRIAAPPSGLVLPGKA